MRTLLTIVLVLLCSVVFSKNYYVAATGSNSAAGTISAPWQTSSKVNSFSFATGDSVLYRRGDTFYGAVTLGGVNMGAYGTGPKPIITGMSPVSGWVTAGSNVWEAPISAKDGVNIVTVGGVIQQIGRYPNLDNGNGGYFTLTAATSTSITGNGLSSVYNWAGAEVVMRSNRWSLDRQKVITHSGGTITFKSNPDVPRGGFGYFFQRDSKTLDKDGEWYYNPATKRLRIYFPTSPTGVEICTVDSLLTIKGNNTTVTNISFVGGNRGGILANGRSNILIKDCDVLNSSQAIFTWFCTNVTVDNCTTTNSLSSGIFVRGATTATVNTVVKNNTVTNTSYIAGMDESNTPNNGAGLSVVGGDNLIVINNTVLSSGYNGMEWKGNNLLIKNNLVDRFCFVRDDGAAIYTYAGAAVTTVGVNRRITGNILLNGVGAAYGTSAKEPSANGLYVDEGTRGVIIDSNTVYNMPYNGINGNSNSDILIRDNTVVNTYTAVSFQRLTAAPPIRGIEVLDNIFYPYRFRYRNLAIDNPTLLTKEADIALMIELDGSLYSLRPGKDSSLFSTVRWVDGTHAALTAHSFAFLQGLGQERGSLLLPSNGTLYYTDKLPKTIFFPGLAYRDAHGAVYNNSITLLPYTSKLLFPNGTTTVPPILPKPKGLFLRHR